MKKFPLLRGKVDTLHVGDLQTADTLRILAKFFDGKKQTNPSFIIQFPFINISMSLAWLKIPISG